MTSVARFTTFVLVALLPAGLPAQAPVDVRAVQPERPTVATHAYSVAPGVLEIETGVEVDRFGDGSRVLSVPTTIKIGVASHLQLNIVAPVTGPGLSSLGAGDAALGVKWRLLDEHGVLGSFALLPALKFASGSVPIGRGTGTTDLSLTVISSRTIGKVSVDLNVAATWRSGDGTQAPRRAWLWTVSFGIPVRGGLGWALEYFGYPGTAGPAGTPGWSAVLTGPQLVLRRWLAVDAGVIVPLSGPQVTSFYSGMVWNAGRIWRTGAP